MLLDRAAHNDKTAPDIIRVCTADYDSLAALNPAFVAGDEKRLSIQPPTGPSKRPRPYYALAWRR